MVMKSEVYPVCPVASENGTGIGTGNRTGAHLTGASSRFNFKETQLSSNVTH